MEKEPEMDIYNLYGNSPVTLSATPETLESDMGISGTFQLRKKAVKRNVHEQTNVREKWDVLASISE